MTTKQKKDFILSVFNNRTLDQIFIDGANSLGYTKYFMNLESVEDMSDSKVSKCYTRVCEVLSNSLPHGFTFTSHLKPISINLNDYNN